MLLTKKNIVFKIQWSNKRADRPHNDALMTFLAPALIITIIIRRRFRALGKHYFITEKIISYHHYQGLWGRRRDDKYPNAIRNPKRVSSK